MSLTRTMLVVLIMLALALSISVGVARVRVEQAARSAALVLDGRDARALAVESGRTLEVVLRKFGRAGVTAVSAYDETLPELIARGRVTVTPAQWTQDVQQAAGGEPGIAIVTEDAALGEAIALRLASRFPASALDLPEGGPAAQGYHRVIFHGGLDELDGMGICLARDITSAAREARLAIVARTVNYPGVTDLALRNFVGDAAEQQAGYVIFDEDEVLGYPQLVPNLARALRLGGLVYGSVELADQRGDRELARLLGGAVVRVHSITEKELPTVSREQAAQRFVRAVTERNARICYLRALGGGRSDRMRANIRYAQDIAQGLSRRGFVLGAPALFGPVGAPRWALLVIGAGVAAGAVLLCGLVLPMGSRWHWILLAVGVAVAAALVLAGGVLGRKALALLGALAFPTLGLVALARWLDAAAGKPPGRRSALSLVATAVAALVGVSLVSLTGGLLIGALLTDRLFMVKAEQFEGVKAAMLLPLAALALVLVGGAYARREGWAEYARRVGDRYRQFLSQPVAVWQAVLAGAVLGAAVLLVMRSGNEPAAGVSQLEMKVRALLENWLMARPRNKEFLFGHPALILAVVAGLRGRPRWAAVLLLAGGVGQVSLLNTFCHIHSPLLLSLLRTAHGLWIGTAVAAVVLLAWRLAARRRPARAP